MKLEEWISGRDREAQEKLEAEKERLKQKGAVENINKLIRQYIKKGSDFDQYDNNFFIKQTQMKINKRPRKKLKFEAPITVFQRLMKKVALAG